MKITSQEKLQKLFTKQEHLIKSPKLNGKVITYTKSIKGLGKFLLVLWYGLFCNKKSCQLAKKGEMKVSLNCKMDVEALHKVYDTFFLSSDLQRLSQKWNAIKPKCILLGRGTKETQQKINPLMLICNEKFFNQGDGKVLQLLKEMLFYCHSEDNFKSLYTIVLRKGIQLKEPRALYDYALMHTEDEQLEENTKYSNLKVYKELEKWINSRKTAGIFQDHEYYVIYQNLFMKSQPQIVTYNSKAEKYLQAFLNDLNKKLKVWDKDMKMEKNEKLDKLFSSKKQLEEVLTCGDREDVLDCLFEVCTALHLYNAFPRGGFSLLLSRIQRLES